ncbi:hypothetical protein L1049_016878 [Liquidambar formosana]|uniref:Uncharacterized protein n=1 Tax=Liquidambar formosana TaxID=63359 RepID=A0AAP0S6Q6_LIQFO
MCVLRMASASIIGFLAILLVLQPETAIGDMLSPLLSPIFDEVCKGVECGKGTCKPSRNSTFFFVCECDPGWKQSRSDDDDHLMFLPCVIPNCTLDYSCSAAAPSPVQVKGSQNNESVFDPCFWTYCGGGSCNKTSKFTHKCECQEGYDNLLNMTAFPCFRECAIGLDCTNLGIGAANKSASSTPNFSGTGGNNQASSFLQWNFNWLIVFTDVLGYGAVEIEVDAEGFLHHVSDRSYIDFTISCLFCIYLVFDAFIYFILILFFGYAVRFLCKNPGCVS